MMSWIIENIFIGSLVFLALYFLTKKRNPEYIAKLNRSKKWLLFIFYVSAFFIVDIIVRCIIKF